MATAASFAPDARPAGRPAPPSGPVLFARYAYGPNRLRLCGPEDADGLFGEGTAGGDQRRLRQLAQGFEGAYPYLELIARANRIADPLDARVVDAYWLGSPLLDAVTRDDFGESLRVRFRPRLRRATWRWLASSVPAGAVPVHAFHVLDVFPKVGLLRGGQADGVVETMDSCRVRWGRVVGRMGDQLIVNAVPLQLLEGYLRLGPPRSELVTAWRDDQTFISSVAPGDVISIHWNWACDVLDRASLARLISWTGRQIAVANQTL